MLDVGIERGVAITSLKWGLSQIVGTGMV